MAGYLSNYAENKILDHILKIASYSRPDALFVGLCDADPTDAGTGGTISEPSGGDAYTRESCDDWTEAASRATASSTAIVFPEATGGWGVMTHFAILDTSVLATGNIIAFGPITPNKTIATGDIATVDAGDLDVSVDAAGASDYMANAMLDHLFYDTPLAQPGAIFIALCTATVLDNDTGTTISEPGENYARIQHDDWKIAIAGASSNSGTVVFDKATGGTWGTIAHFALCETLVTGNLLLHAACTTPKQIVVDDIAQFADSSIDVTAD